jgi:hypothetical protein
MNSPAYKALEITATTLRLRASELMDNPHVAGAFDAMVRGESPPAGTPYDVWGFICSHRLFIAQFDAMVRENIITRDEADALERISINA